MEITFNDLEVIKELKVSMNLQINSLDEIEKLNRILSIVNDMFEHNGTQYNELKWLAVKMQKTIENFIYEISNKYKRV